MTVACVVPLSLALAAQLPPPPAEGVVRFATFNVWELTGAKLGQGDGEAGADGQLRGAAAIVQAVRPDVLLVNEIDTPPYREAVAAERFGRRYLARPQSVGDFRGEPLSYPIVLAPPTNTGLPSGRDLDQDGQSDGPGDAWGYGEYPGQYGMALYSRFPVDAAAIRSFGRLRWSSLPGNLLPDGTGGKPAYYPAADAAVLRLSSKTHWDVPVVTPGGVVHVLASHPTPPVFDGAEDRNGRRLFDELRLWAEYLDGASWIIDDDGRRGGLAADASFVFMGDLNAREDEPDVPYGQRPIDQLLKHPRVHDPKPASAGATAENRGRPPETQSRATHGVGRLDYVLPSEGMTVVAAGVVWPTAGQPLGELMGDRRRSSDHHLVWVDVRVSQD